MCILWTRSCHLQVQIVSSLNVFCFFVLLNALAGLCSTMSTGSGESKHSFLFLILRGESFQYLPIKYDVNYVFVLPGCLFPGWGISILFQACRVFLWWKKCWILLYAVSSSNEMIILFCLFFSVYMCFIFNQPCYPRIASTWSWCIILFMFSDFVSECFVERSIFSLLTFSLNLF